MNIIEKIKKLLNNTVENGCTEEEAQISLSLARKLMIKHKLSENDINIKEDKLVMLKVLDDFSINWKYLLIRVFIDNFAIMHFMDMSNNSSKVVLFGNKLDIQCVDTLYKCANDYISKHKDIYFKDYIELFGPPDESTINAYNLGFINGLQAKYEEQNKNLTSDEALMIIPNNYIKSEFNKLKDNFETKEINFVKDEISQKDYLAKCAGYQTGKKFGTTGIED